MSRPLTAVLAAVLLFASAPAVAQRASLADRVAVLEQRAANTQANVELLNQLAQMRTELQSLRSQLEELGQANEQLRATARAQYLDVDGRLERLEGGGARPSVTTPPSSSGSAPSSPARASVQSAAPTSPAPATRQAFPAWTSGTSAGEGDALPTGNERADYDVAFDALKAGRYADASRLFSTFLDRHPGGVYAPNALYWLGESYYVTLNYALALEQFERLLDRFPTHDKAPGALLKVGLTRIGLRQDAAARTALEEVVARYPGTDAARSAADRLQSMRIAR
jgi:tol-pal system protein YbgF